MQQIALPVQSLRRLQSTVSSLPANEQKVRGQFSRKNIQPYDPEKVSEEVSKCVCHLDARKEE